MGTDRLKANEPNPLINRVTDFGDTH